MTDTTLQNTKSKNHSMTLTALMTAVTCILAPLSIPIGPVPISLTNLVIYLSLYLLGWKKGTLSLLVYLLIGMAGLPVFSGFSGGLSKLVGPTGGYIIGFIPMAIIAGMILQKSHSRWIHFLGFLLGTALCYMFGTLWFCRITGSGMAAALNVCVLPFLPGDLLKILLAICLGLDLRRRLLNLHH